MKNEKWKIKKLKILPDYKITKIWINNWVEDGVYISILNNSGAKIWGD